MLHNLYVFLLILFTNITDRSRYTYWLYYVFYTSAVIIYFLYILHTNYVCKIYYDCTGIFAISLSFVGHTTSSCLN